MSILYDFEKLFDCLMSPSQAQAVKKVMAQYIASEATLKEELSNSKFTFRGTGKNLEFILKTKKLGSLFGKLEDVSSGDYKPTRIIYKDAYGIEYYLVGEKPSPRVKK